MFTIRFFTAGNELAGEKHAASLVEAIERAGLWTRNSNLAKRTDQQPVIRYVIADDQGNQVHEQFVR